MKFRLVQDKIVGDKFVYNLTSGKVSTHKHTSPRKRKAYRKQALRYWEKAHNC